MDRHHAAHIDLRTKREALAWLEIETAVAYLSKNVPGLSQTITDPCMIKTVPASKVGSKPFHITWCKDQIGKADLIELPSTTLAHPAARKQAAWLVAGFLHAGARTGSKDPLHWKRIAQAGGIAGTLFAPIRQSLSLSRLEPLAMLILAAGGKLSWTRLRVPGVHHWTARIRHHDVHDAGWLGKSQKTALDQTHGSRPKGDHVLALLIEQAGMECKQLGTTLGKNKGGSVAIGISNAIDLLLSKKGKQPGKPASALESRILRLAKDRKIDNRTILDVLQSIEVFELESLPELVHGLRLDEKGAPTFKPLKP